jgi:hypothetical protein
MKYFWAYSNLMMAVINLGLFIFQGFPANLIVGVICLCVGFWMLSL